MIKRWLLCWRCAWDVCRAWDNGRIRSAKKTAVLILLKRNQRLDPEFW